MTRGVRRAAFAFAMDTGSVNSLSVQLSPPIQAYEQGTEIRVLVANDNTGQATIRVDGLATQQIIRKDGTPLLAGDLRRGGVAVLVHDGTNFQLVSGTTGSVNISGTGWFNGADYIVDVGPVNHIQGSPPVVPTAYAAGQGFTILIKNQNTGPVDIAVATLGIKPLKLPNTIDLQPGDIMPNMLIRVWYDGINFIMLSPIYRERIEVASTFIVGPQAGADFADLNAAMKWLNRRRIGMNGSVTLSLQGATSGNALQHIYTQSIVIAHPDSSRLAIVGPTPTAEPTASNFSSTYPPVAGNINADIAFNLSMVRGKFRAEINMASGVSFFVLTPLGMLRNVLIVGPGLTATPASNGLQIFAKTFYDTVCSCNFNGCGLGIDINASFTGRNLYAFGSTVFPIGISHAGVLLVNDLKYNFPVGSASGAGTAAPGWFFCGNSYVDGIQMTFDACVQVDCTGNTSNARIMGCGQKGIDHWGDSSAIFAGAGRGAMIAHCGQIGILTVTASASVGGLLVASCNQGFVTSTNGTIDCSNASTTGIAAGDYVATHGSFMYAAGFQNGAAQFSPARNVVGNGNAYIEA